MAFRSDQAIRASSTGMTLALAITASFRGVPLGTT